MKKVHGLKQYYSYQTKLAQKNFPFSTTTVHKELIDAMAIIKEATAYAHMTTGGHNKDIAHAIITAAKEILEGEFDDQFTLPGLQGGAGTSIHMNVNEVIATRATELLEQKGITVHPNDHVNKSQSTNDVGPSALKIATIKLVTNLMKTLDEAANIFSAKSDEFRQVTKLGRTHIQDAVPTTLGEEFESYTAVIKRCKDRLGRVLPYLYELNIGGTAIGNSVNASESYRKEVYKALRRITKYKLKPATNLMSQTSSQTDFVFISQALTSVMADFSKIANDLRLLASGPQGGLGEIAIKELQPGSSIMPGKVNPILPESINQAYFAISGNNLTIEMAAQAAQLELGVMIPVIADRLISSLKLSHEVISAFANNCVYYISANEKKCKELLENSSAYATMLTPELGYEQVSKMVKTSRQEGKKFQEFSIALPSKPQ
jgi:aspartate ammonia-lyase